MVLRFWLDDGLPDALQTQLWYRDTTLENERLYLGYWIGSDKEKNGCFDIEYGISWPDCDSTPSKSAKSYRLEAVVALRKKLASMDFKEEGSCVGWRPLHDCKSYDSVDEFLAFLAKDPEQVVRDMADRFWSLVQETLKLVEKANNAIIGKS